MWIHNHSVFDREVSGNTEIHPVSLVLPEFALAMKSWTYASNAKRILDASSSTQSFLALISSGDIDISTNFFEQLEPVHQEEIFWFLDLIIELYLNNKRLLWNKEIRAWDIHKFNRDIFQWFLTFLSKIWPSGNHKSLVIISKLLWKFSEYYLELQKKHEWEKQEHYFQEKAKIATQTRPLGESIKDWVANILCLNQKQVTIEPLARKSKTPTEYQDLLITTYARFTEIMKSINLRIKLADNTPAIQKELMKMRWEVSESYHKEIGASYSQINQLMKHAA